MTTMPNYHIRPAQIDDLPAIQDIYNYEVEHGTSTWNQTCFDLTYFEHILQRQQHHFPLLVLEDCQQKEIMGYACYDLFRSIQGFQATVEHSIFVRPEYSGKGFGSQLLSALIQHAESHDVHIMVAAIDYENLSSIALHEKFGFIQTGYMPQVGQKFGQWRDLVLMQLYIQKTNQH